MQKLFKRQKRKDNAEKPAIIGQLTEKVINIQHKAADFLNEKANSWQPERMKVLLVMFCLLFGTASLFIMGKAILYPKTGNSIIVRTVKIPEHIGHVKSEIIVYGQFISRNEYQRLEQFRQYIDSLGITENGMKIKDSILSRRPKLMDSLALVEQLYNKQK